MGQGIHLCRRKSKFHLQPLRKSTKIGLAWCPLVLEKKCELTTPHNFGSRNPSVSREIKITPSAIMKKHKNGSSLVSVGPREKVQINNPPPPHNYWSRNPSVSTEIKISPSAIKKKHQNGSNLVSVGPREKVRINDPPTILSQGIHLCQRKSKFNLRPLRKSTKMGLAWCPLVLEKKCELTTPHNFGSRNPSVSTESKLHLQPLRKSTKIGLAWCLLVLEKKCELTTPHNFGSRNPSVSTEIKISPSSIKKKHQNWSSLVSVGPREKV